MKIGDSEHLKVGYSEHLKVGDNEHLKVGDSEHLKGGDSEHLKVGDNEHLKGGDSEHLKHIPLSELTNVFSKAHHRTSFESFQANCLSNTFSDIHDITLVLNDRVNKLQ